MKKLMAGLLASAVLAYPLFVYFSLSRFEPRVMAMLLGTLLLARALLAREPGIGSEPHRSRKRIQGIVAGLILGGLVLYTVASNQLTALKLYPVIISFSLLLAFAASLVYPPSLIERIARRTDPELSARGVVYTRKVTLLWCGFFLLNGLVALYTTLYASIGTWTLYNGLLSYLLIGLLLGGEFLYRHFCLDKTL